MVSADNPAACLVGGYKNLHSATRKCRTCMAVESDMQTVCYYKIEIMYYCFLV